MRFHWDRSVQEFSVTSYVTTFVLVGN